jgi:hypothetical protein
MITGVARIGLVHGVHHRLLGDIPERARLHYEENKPFETTTKVTRYRPDGFA